MNNRQDPALASTSLSSHASNLIRLLTPERLEIIYRHARSTYPRECCGMVLASGIVRPCDNAQDKLHQLDPQSFPRTSTNAFCFDVEDQLFLARSFEGDDPARIVYHSHPNAAPDFSETDRRGTICDGEAIYPEVGYLIVQSRIDCIGPAKLYIYTQGEYQEVANWALENKP